MRTDSAHIQPNENFLKVLTSIKNQMRTAKRTYKHKLFGSLYHFKIFSASENSRFPTIESMFTTIGLLFHVLAYNYLNFTIDYGMRATIDP